MTILQKDISISRVQSGVKFNYQLVIKDEPVLEKTSGKVYDFGLINIQPDGKATMELYMNSEYVPDADLTDPDTYIVPISVKIPVK